ncbi:MAG: hypothetical protein ACREXY_07890, partial [Gammaproteobacteria bacterium]
RCISIITAGNINAIVEGGRLDTVKSTVSYGSIPRFLRGDIISGDTAKVADPRAVVVWGLGAKHPRLPD